ncbi:protein NDH-DEPENDENT CYCLIC ELECTRON FLOW 5 [Typha latifolia]|uniref:protein NDH-DEPENDENT CYCLIC ELECTRON FLOW 5 n=1 Tax=Typha latifolia TaxID=4733 RepID=UPI003C2C5DDA
MTSTAAFFPNSTPLPPRNPWKQLERTHRHLFCNYQPHKHGRQLSLQAVASGATLPINVDYLVREFSGHGVNFEGIGDNCVIKMGLENGSMASLMLPSGLITSYKPFMWHGTTLEVLHTTVSEGEDREAVVIQGGVSTHLKCVSDVGTPWSPTSWFLHDVRGSSEKSIQVELVSVAPQSMIEVRYLVTLQRDLLASEFTITNLKSSSLQLSGSIMNHLKVSTPDATYAVGLQGSNYRSQQPVMSEFSIIPPDYYESRSPTTNQSWTEKTLEGLLFSTRKKKGDMKDEAFGDGSEGEEDDDYSQMTEKLCRIYTSAPREFTVIDRGRRNSVDIGRSGFDELYILSPGSNHDWYGKYAFICIGPTMLKPVFLGPGGVWKGAQYLHNPNL